MTALNIRTASPALALVFAAIAVTNVAEASTAGALFRIEQDLDALHQKIDAQDAALAELSLALDDIAAGDKAEIVTIPFSSTLNDLGQTSGDAFTVPDGKILIVKYFAASISDQTNVEFEPDQAFAELTITGAAITSDPQSSFISQIQSGRILASRITPGNGDRRNINFSVGKTAYAAFGAGDLRFFARINIAGDRPDIFTNLILGGTLTGVLIEAPTD